MGDVLTDPGGVRAVEALEHLLGDRLVQQDVDLVAAHPGHHRYGDRVVPALQSMSVSTKSERRGPRTPMYHSTSNATCVLSIRRLVGYSIDLFHSGTAPARRYLPLRLSKTSWGTALRARRRVSMLGERLISDPSSSWLVMVARHFRRPSASIGRVEGGTYDVIKMAEVVLVKTDHGDVAETFMLVALL